MAQKICFVCKKNLDIGMFSNKQKKKEQPKCKTCTHHENLQNNKIEPAQNNNVNPPDLLVNISGQIINENFNLKNENLNLRTQLEMKQTLIINLQEQLKNQKELLEKLGSLEIENENKSLTFLNWNLRYQD